MSDSPTPTIAPVPRPVKSAPRAPSRLPGLGHLLPLFCDPLRFFKNLRTTGDLVRIDLGTLPVYVPTSADLIHEVMVAQARHFEKGRLFDRVRDIFGDGLATAAGDIHRKHRRLIQPMFHRNNIAAYGEIMSDQTRALVASWKPGDTIAADHEMSELAIAILTHTLFASSAIGQPAMEEIRRNMPIILSGLLKRAVAPKILDHLPIPANRKFDASSQRLRRLFDDLITQGRQAGPSDQIDLLSLLLAARYEDGQALSNAEIRDELFTINFAGTETVAGTLAWCLHEIATHPDVEQALLDEINAVVGDRAVTVTDVPQLTYTGRVIDEAIRLHSTTLLMRRTTEPIELGGYAIPAGTEVAFSLYALHQDPRYYPNPQRFDPDRWLPYNKIPREAYAPFGGGNRKCIGDTFAITEITIALATIYSHCRLRPAPNHTVREIPAGTPLPNRLPLIIHPRLTT